MLQNTPHEGCFATHDPIAWLSELTKQRDYISLAVEKLEMLVV
jgi:hypothetical protein